MAETSFTLKHAEGINQGNTTLQYLLILLPCLRRVHGALPIKRVMERRLAQHEAVELEDSLTREG
eukprot:5675394-Pleurochrysis_carterae.AAC.1